MSESKVCKECNVSKDKTDFYKNRNKCKTCVKIIQTCPHKKQKNLCIDCGGVTICSHGKSKSRCIECGGGSLCPHDPNKKRRKDHCIICCPKRFCIHEKQKNECKECGGSSFCEHNKNRSTCKECKGSSICEHNKRRYDCKECKGKGICIHNKIKQNCITCNPSCACIECELVYVNKKCLFRPYCQACFCNKFPDNEKSTLYKIKERYLRDELRLKFPGNKIDMIFDKIVDGGCSRRRPDILIDLLTYSIIIECDENQHKDYDCENRRTMELFRDLGDRPIIFIRFNPDSYINKNNIKIEACFKSLIEEQDINRKRFYNIIEKEWNRRLDILEKVIKENISLDTFPSKEVTEIKLFYNGYD
jgi:hypothetical protein